jgi:UDP-3-O-[3-hydroxymyristoyl] N-acetylglucosamine deacetylase
MQKTLQNSIEINGIGLHSGKMIRLVVKPAAEDHGIVFIRTDMPAGEGLIPALWNYVVDTQLCTVIGNEHGARVGTIEHLMAALCGCGIDNALIEIDGAEVPVMDGSAMPFVERIEAAGIQAQALPRRAIKVLKPVTVEQDGKKVTLTPALESSFSGDIEFDHPSIGRQSFETTLVNGNFKHDVADARTFGFVKEVEFLRKNGLALGGSLDNAIVLGDDGVMNPGGLRSANEFIRHKILDAIGDLFLAGGPILGSYSGHKAGHAMNNAILKALFADPSSYEVIDVMDMAKPRKTADICETSAQIHA